METALHFGKGLSAPAGAPLGSTGEGSARRKLGQALAGSGAPHALPSPPARLLSCVCSSQQQLTLPSPPKLWGYPVPRPMVLSVLQKLRLPHASGSWENTPDEGRRARL